MLFRSVLIPCWVDREKYIDCQDDKEKRDEVIRREMNANGDFNAILNVLSALKQSDEDIYNICLNYPKQFMREETSKHLKRYNYQLLEDQCGDLRDILEYFGINILPDENEDTTTDNSDTDSFDTTTLPVDSVTIYEGNGSNQSVVVMIPYGSGKIYVLGWDWYGAAPLGGSDGGWLHLLQSVLQS